MGFGGSNRWKYHFADYENQKKLTDSDTSTVVQLSFKGKIKITMTIVMLMTCDKLDEVPCDDVSKEGERLEELSWVGSRHETQGEDGGEMVGLGSMRQGRREGGPPFHNTTFFFQHSNIIINIEYLYCIISLQYGVKQGEHPFHNTAIFHVSNILYIKKRKDHSLLR